MSKENIYTLKPLDTENVSDYFATVGALACMMADAYEDACDGKREDAMLTMSLVDNICGSFNNNHLDFLYCGMSAAIAKVCDEQNQREKEG